MELGWGQSRAGGSVLSLVTQGLQGELSHQLLPLNGIGMSYGMQTIHFKGLTISGDWAWMVKLNKAS